MYCLMENILFREAVKSDIENCILALFLPIPTTICGTERVFLSITSFAKMVGNEV